MKSISVLVFILFCSTTKLYSQTKETYQFSQDINYKIEKDTVKWKYQTGATAYSISGYYKKHFKSGIKTEPKFRYHK